MRYLVLLTLLSCVGERQKSEVKRVVSLAPSLTEMVFFLGAQNRLVGVTTFCDYPPEAKKITKIGDFSNPNLERIVALKPDLVLAALPEQRRIVAELSKMGISVFTSHPKTIDAIIDEMDSLAHLFGLPFPEDSLKKLIYPLPNFDRKPKVYIELAADPIITVGHPSYLNDLIIKSGGINIFASVEVEFPVVSWEEVVRADPDLILIFHNQRCEERLGWKELTAVKNGMVFSGLNEDVFLRPGPRIFIALSELRRIIEGCVPRL
ncbi:hypothetical protein DRP53_08385 [candidate division WOR-3 bacterium]|uniref:Fe/B12 periplasmic-binding domain-containing protein n=1 Tax=candidate division WOR-3 bacterium TaxID=2052148 RepID=A0A660SGU4_UNCW3|nr:MAG: hypothetical protein DRP53_08385 [candidate division WOR-3 bacterium]